MDIIKETPQRIADYLNYLVLFSLSPRKALSADDAAKDAADPTIDPTLILYAAFGVGVGYVIVQIGAAIGMAEDHSRSAFIFGNIDRTLLPVAGLIGIFVLSIAGHILMRLVGVIAPLLGQEPFRGSFAGSLNAALGFAAWSVPIMTTVIIVIRIAAAQDEQPDGMLLGIAMIPISLAFWIYLIAAIAGAHRISFRQAASLYGLIVLVLVFGGKAIW